MQHSLTPVTIEDLIRDEALPLALVTLGGRSPDTEVSWLHTTEQVDPRPHLRPHELVCTLGSGLVKAENARRFVTALTSSRVAGIVLGLGEVHLKPPRALVECCEEFGLPLLVLPHGAPFQSLNETLLRRRGEIENAARQRENTLL